MVVIQYLISGGSTTAPDKRSIAPIMRALCKRIRFPCGMLQYNELVMHGSQTLQTIVKWVHEEKVSVEKFQRAIGFTTDSACGDVQENQ
eukprot:2150490-Rhodomonas_salina.3